MIKERINLEQLFEKIILIDNKFPVDWGMDMFTEMAIIIGCNYQVLLTVSKTYSLGLETVIWTLARSGVQGSLEYFFDNKLIKILNLYNWEVKLYTLVKRKITLHLPLEEFNGLLVEEQFQFIVDKYPENVGTRMEGKYKWTLFHFSYYFIEFCGDREKKIPVSCRAITRIEDLHPYIGDINLQDLGF